tara:strand:+ start:810 stop:1067 length:258 start_codon:yes stop_codon:yes gene_type:complete
MNKGDRMKICQHHPRTELQYAEMVTTKTINGNLYRNYHDVEYCPKCFEEYEQGKQWKHDILGKKPLFTNITKQVDSVIDGQIDER